VAPLQLTVQHPDFDTVQVTIEGSLDLARAYDFDDAMRRIDPDAVVIDGAGHNAHWEAPEAVWHLLT